MTHQDIIHLREFLASLQSPQIIVIQRTGDISIHAPDADAEIDIEFLQPMVGGYVERINNPHLDLAFCDEEGKLKGQAPNDLATKLLGLKDDDHLVGTVVILANCRFE